MALVTRQGAFVDNDDCSYTWTVAGLDADDDSTAFGLPPGIVAMSIQVTGTPDSGVLNLYGSNDGSTFAALTTAVQFSNATGIKSVATADLGYKQYKIVMTAGGGASTDLDATVHMRTTCP